MITKTLLDLNDKNLGATGGTDYSDPFTLKGPLDLASLVAYLYAKNEGGSSPTLDVNMQASWDGGTNWIDTGLAFTQVQTSTNSNESKQWGSNLIGPKVRVKYVIGGTSTPTYDIKVILSAFAIGYWG